jgi:hypothetical protein
MAASSWENLKRFQVPDDNAQLQKVLSGESKLQPVPETPEEAAQLEALGIRSPASASSTAAAQKSMQAANPAAVNKVTTQEQGLPEVVDEKTKRILQSGATPESKDILNQYMHTVLPLAQAQYLTAGQSLDMPEKLTKEALIRSLGQDSIPSMTGVAQLGEVLTGKPMMPLAQTFESGRKPYEGLQNKLLSIQAMKAAASTEALKGLGSAIEGGYKMAKPELTDVLKALIKQPSTPGPKYESGTPAPDKRGSADKPLPTKIAEHIADSEGKITEVKSNMDLIKKNLSLFPADNSYTGSAEGWLNHLSGQLGLDQNARYVNDTISMMNEQIGRLLQGGVLRKDAWKRYDKMLPNFGDSQTTVLKKIDNIDKKLETDYKLYLNTMVKSGYNKAANFQGPTSSPATPSGNLTTEQEARRQELLKKAGK